MQMQQIITTREANEREDLRGSLSQQTTLMGKDPIATQNIVLDLNNKLLDINKGNRNKTNAETNEIMENLIRTVNDSDPALAKKILKNYKVSLLNPENPNFGTYGQRFNLKELSDLLQTTADQREAEANEALKEEAEGIVEVFYNNRTPANYREAIQRLRAVPQTPEVRSIIEQFTRNGPDYDPLRADQLGAAAKNLAELEALKKQGVISADIYDRESNRFAEEKAVKDLLPPDSAIKGKAKDILKQLTGNLAGSIPEYFDNASALAVEDMLGYAKATVEAELKSGKLDPVGGAINKRLQEVLQTIAPDYVSGEGKSIKILPSSKNLNLKVTVSWPNAGNAGGQNGRYLVDLVQSRVPRVTSAVKDTIIGPDRWDLAIESLSSGTKVPSDVEFAAKTAGVSVPEFLRRQAPKLGRIYDSKVVENGNKIYQQNRAINPRLAELIANPRTTPRQREQYQIEIQRLKQDQTPVPPTSSPKSLSSFKSQVSSIVLESPSGQPGLDIFFENKQFPAVLSGTVKDINYEPGYGNYVVIESIDPDTGEKVDVLYGHLASRTPLKIGQTITAGQLVGKQGGTGNVRSADGTIASIDFLAPAPRGSGSMTPYRNFDKLRRRIAKELGK